MGMLVLVKWSLQAHDQTGAPYLKRLSSTSSGVGKEKSLLKGTRSKPRKQYLIHWKPSWVNSGRLTAPGLMQNWKKERRQQAGVEPPAYLDWVPPQFIFTCYMSPCVLRIANFGRPMHLQLSLRPFMLHM